jgi:hypothetical protein
MQSSTPLGPHQVNAIHLFIDLCIALLLFAMPTIQEHLATQTLSELFGTDSSGARIPSIENPGALVLVASQQGIPADEPEWALVEHIWRE